MQKSMKWVFRNLIVYYTLRLENNTQRTIRTAFDNITKKWAEGDEIIQVIKATVKLKLFISKELQQT